MVRKKAAAEIGALAVEAMSENAADSTQVPATYEIKLNRAVKHDRTWLRPNFVRIVVDQATLDALQEQGAIVSAERID
jgi:hypothetical protein